MEQGNPSTSGAARTRPQPPSSHPITDDERLVCEILLNLPRLIHLSESHSELFVWGGRGKRSSIHLSRLPPRQQRPAKKPKIASGDLSPATPLAFSPSESDEKAHQSHKKAPKKPRREDLLEKMEDLSKQRELLTREVERVKSYLSKLQAYNMQLKVKKQETKFGEKMEISKSRDHVMESSEKQLAAALPSPLPDDQLHHNQFLALFRRQHYFNIYPLATSSSLPPPPPPGVVSLGRVNHVGPTGLPDLNASAEEMSGVGPSEPLLPRARAAAEARKRRMVKMKQMKLSSSNC